MKSMKFKTNMKCAGCIAGIKPKLDAEKEIENWEVTLQSPQSILTVYSSTLSQKAIVEIVERAGFTAEFSE
jgi:copper chaperone